MDFRSKLLDILFKIFIWIIVALSAGVLLSCVSTKKKLNPKIIKVEKSHFFKSKSVGKDKLKRNTKKYERKESKATGVILKFYNWPSVKETQLIIKHLNKKGLKKLKTVESFKIWLFEWPEVELKSARMAWRSCKNISKLSARLNYCEPNYLLTPDSKLMDTEATSTDIECKTCNENKIQPIKNVNTCELVASKLKLKKGQLSDYWAQELIGSDLLRKEFEKVPIPKKENFITVIEFGDSEDRHMNLVKNLISDEGSHAILPRLEGKSSKWNKIKKTDTNTSLVTQFINGGATSYLIIAEKLKYKPPSFINSSIGWGQSKTVYEAFKSLSSHSILVASAGNYFPEKIDKMQEKASKDFDAILVGSFSPKGFVSEFSKEGEEVHILAPSDLWLTSMYKNKPYKNFGGTSGAAPLVTGSLAGFEWLSGYHPTAKEAKIILKETALPTLHSRQNKVGLLNSYRIGMVAKRLKKKCEDKELTCFAKEIRDKKNYQFQVDENKIKKDIDEVFSACSFGNKKSQAVENTTCEQKKKVFTKLRKTILLKPNHRELWESLSCIYRQEGFSENAKALDNIALAFDNSKVVVEKLMKQILSSDEGLEYVIRRLNKEIGFEIAKKMFTNKNLIIRRGVIYGLSQNDEGLPFLEKFAEDKSSDVRKTVALSLSEMGYKGLPLLEKLAEDENSDVRKTVIWSLSKIGNKGLPLLEKLAEDENSDVRESVARSLSKIGNKGLPLLEKLAKDENSNIRKTVAVSLYEIGDKGLPLLEKLAKDRSSFVRRSAVWGLSEIGDKGLPLLEKLAKDKNSNVRRSATLSLSEMGAEGLPLLEKLAKDKNSNVRRSATLSLYKIGAEGLPLLEKLAKDKNSNVRRSATLSLSEMGDKGLSLLEKLAKDKSSYVRQSVARSLFGMGNKGLSLLEKLAKNKSSDVRRSVELSLSEMGDKGLPLLEKLATSDDSNIRKSAILSLYKIGDKGLPLLEKLAKNKSSDVRRSVVVLGLSKMDGKIGLPLLEKLAASDDPNIRESIIWSLSKLGDKKWVPLYRKLATSDDPNVRELAEKILSDRQKGFLPPLQESFYP